QMDLAEHARQSPVTIGEQRGVEVFPVGLLTEADVHGDARLGRLTQERLERLWRNVRLEELVVVLADALREIRRQCHLGIGDDLDALVDGLLEQGEHAFDDGLAWRAVLVRAHLRGGDLDMAWHKDPPSLADTPLIPEGQARGSYPSCCTSGLDRPDAD